MMSFPSSNLDEIDKAGLVQRWAFNDKKTLNVRDLAKKMDPAEYKAFQKFDKEDSVKKFKENILPFENLFLEYL